MCYWAIAAQVVGTAVKGYAAYAGAQSQVSAAKTNEANALQSGYSQELSFRDQARLKLASQVNELGGRGVDISTGTPLSLLATSARNQEMDALTIRKNAQTTANGFLAQAHGYQVAQWMGVAGQILNSGQSGLGQLGQLGGGQGGGMGSMMGGGGDASSASDSADSAGTMTDATGDAVSNVA